MPLDYKVNYFLTKLIINIFKKKRAFALGLSSKVSREKKKVEEGVVYAEFDILYKVKYIIYYISIRALKGGLVEFVL